MVLVHAIVVVRIESNVKRAARIGQKRIRDHKAQDLNPSSKVDLTRCGDLSNAIIFNFHNTCLRSRGLASILLCLLLSMTNRCEVRRYYAKTLG